MFQILYLLVFSILAVLAVVNLARSLFMVAADTQKISPTWQQRSRVPHPELLDSSGQVVNEPLMVIRSAPANEAIDDIRNRLDALYQASPGQTMGDGEDPMP